MMENVHKTINWKVFFNLKVKNLDVSFYNIGKIIFIIFLDIEFPSENSFTSIPHISAEVYT